MKFIGLIVMAILLSSCSNSTIQSTYDSDFDRFDPAGKTNANGKTMVDLNPTIEEEYQTGTNSNATPSNKPLNTNALIKLNNAYPYIGCNFDFSLKITTKIAGKNININTKGARISPGKHTVYLTLAAYYKNKPKYIATRKYQVLFNKLDEVLITPSVFVKKINTTRQVVGAEVNIKGLKFNFNDYFNMKDKFSGVPSCA